MEVIIIGKGKGWEDAPEDGNTWGVNDLCSRRDVKVIFEMHKEGNEGNAKEMEISKAYAIKHNIPFIALEVWDNIPSSVRYPIEEMHTEYFNNSLSYMVAYAVYKGATKIDLYGCAIMTGGEYLHQKPNLEYWIGYARGSGAEVIIHEPSTLLKTVSGLMYGYDKHQTKY